MPKNLIEASNQSESESSSEESDETSEDFEWYNPNAKMDKDTYFTYVNKDRKSFDKGDQVYYCYGNRSNKFLLINYGFCYADNKYDSYEILVKKEFKEAIIEDEISIPVLLDQKVELNENDTEKIRFKID